VLHQAQKTKEFHRTEDGGHKSRNGVWQVFFCEKRKKLKLGEECLFPVVLIEQAVGRSLKNSPCGV
jgi:hypothetical protein